MLDMSAVADATVDTARRAFGTALPSSFRVRYELALNLGGTLGTASLDPDRGPFEKAYVVRLNPNIMLRASADESRETLVHEIAHCLDHALVDTLGHGPSWKLLMKMMGYVDARPCHTVDTAGFGVKRDLTPAYCTRCGKSCGVTVRQKAKLRMGRQLNRKCNCGGELTHVAPPK